MVRRRSRAHPLKISMTSHRRLGSGHLLVRAPCFAQAPHLANRIHKDSPFFGLIKEFLADVSAIHSEKIWRMSNSDLFVSELADASADHAYHTRNAGGLQSIRRFPSLLERVSPLVALMGVNSLDVLLDVHGDTFPVFPIFPLQVRQNPKWPQLIATHIYYLHYALVDVVVNDSLSHECSDGYTAHIVDDNRLQGVTAELTVSRHVVRSKWSKPFLFGFFDSVGFLMPRFPSCHQHPLRNFQRRAVFSYLSRAR